jgi:FkbM family methyltransferase
MLDYIKRKIEKIKLKRTFKEYGTYLTKFNVEGYGEIQFAQWQHHSEKEKVINKSKISFYNKLAPLGSFIIDIGAHTGDTTVPMALAVGKEGLVLALEPNQYVFKVLQENSKLNTHFTNIHPICYAATEKDGEFIFNYSDASFCNGGYLSQIKNQNHKHNFPLKVKGINLENYLLKHYSKDLERLSLIKIDAEGFDKEIIKTLPEILKQYKPSLMIECYKKLTESERYELFDSVAEKGYEMFYLENFEENGKMEKIEKQDMLKHKHFEILALPVK